MLINAKKSVLVYILVSLTGLFYDSLPPNSVSKPDWNKKIKLDVLSFTSSNFEKM